MLRCRPRWTVAVGAVVLVWGLAGCHEAAVDGTFFPRVPPDGPAVVNDAWRIVKMATALDVFTIEVEVVDLETSSEVARALVEPLQDRYAEILVYVYADGEGGGGYLPSTRIQWTAAEGFVEIDY